MREPKPKPETDHEGRIVSWSELDALKQCPLKHHLAYEERWTGPETSKALAIGSLFHKVMEAFYSERKYEQEDTPPGEWLGETPHEIIAKYDGNPEYAETVAWMFEGYVENYGDDKLWRVLGIEKQLMVPLPNRAGRKSKITLKGKVDLLIKDNSAGGGLWVVDHKTFSRPYQDKDLEFDDQFGLYIWGLRREGTNVRGVIHNGVRTSKLKREMTPEERFKRTYTVRTDVELENIAREAYEWFQKKPEHGPDGLPRRSTNSDTCGWRCSFTEACLMSRKGGDIRELLEDSGCVQDFTRH